eukprot:10412029-Lingulodinium_polyedra.AAC.1
MQLTARYASRWTCSQWPTWLGFLQGLAIPPAALQEGARGKRPVGSLQLDAWCGATVGMLALLLRWAETLGQHSAQQALKIMEAFLRCSLPEEFNMGVTPEVVEPADCWPLGVEVTSIVLEAG